MSIFYYLTKIIHFKIASYIHIKENNDLQFQLCCINLKISVNKILASITLWMSRRSQKQLQRF